MLMLLCFLTCILARYASSSAFKCACYSCSYVSLASSTRRALSSAFSHKSSSSDFSLNFSTRFASSSVLSRACCCSFCSSSDLCLASRMSQTPSSTFSCVQLCSSNFSLDYSAIRASSSAFVCACCCCSSALRLDSRARQTPSSIFNSARLCSYDFCLDN